MFNAIVCIQIRKIKRVGLVVAVEHVGGVVGDEEAERRGEIVRLADDGVQLRELDIPPVTW